MRVVLMGRTSVNFLTMKKNHKIEIRVTTSDNIEEKHIQKTVENFLNRLERADGVVEAEISDVEGEYSGLSESERDNLRLMIERVSEEDCEVRMMIAEELTERND